MGFKLSGELPEGSTATDLVLTVTEMLRRHGVVGKFVEFYGPGRRHRAARNRATIGNMSPEYGATCAIFPIDDETLRYLALHRPPARQVALVEATPRSRACRTTRGRPPGSPRLLELDLSTVVPSLAGPAARRTVSPSTDARAFRAALHECAGPRRRRAAEEADAASAESFPASDPPAPIGGHQPRCRATIGTLADLWTSPIPTPSRGRT